VLTIINRSFGFSKILLNSPFILLTKSANTINKWPTKRSRYVAAFKHKRKSLIRVLTAQPSDFAGEGTPGSHPIKFG